MLIPALLLAGCAQLPPSPADIQAKRFESVPGKAVIYVVRTPMDSLESSSIALDYDAQISTNPGTYWRWETTPGRHRVAGSGFGTEEVTLNTEAGKIYFLQHTVLGQWRSGPELTRLQQISDQDGRTLVAQSQMIR
jgi:hypothetical protein